MNRSSPDPIAIAGASGFVGSWLMRELVEDYTIIGLSRNEKESEHPNLNWRQADLYSLPKLTKALEGARTGFYLVHSMLPSSRLVQGSFRDLDLLLADNFAKAAQKAGMEHIIYLGGLIPAETGGDLSEHLASRQEVEEVLRNGATPVTVLRSGLILGQGGSSLRILIQLVRRLPIMLLPRWTRQKTQSTDVRDISRAFRLCLENETFKGGTWDVASHPPMTYREMILQSAEVLEKRPATFDFPADCIGLSKLWVALISQTSPSLVNPLLASLKHSMVAQENELLSALEAESIPFQQSVRDSLDEQGRPTGYPKLSTRRQKRRQLRSARRVRSVQRMTLPKAWSAADVAAEYGQWLTRSSRSLINVTKDEGGVLRFCLRGIGPTLLELHPSPLTRDSDDRRVFYINGGVLTRIGVEPPGRFEFRAVDGGKSVIAAIHEYPPRLPWLIYQWSQALIHLWVMRAFGAHLKKTGAD